MIAYATGSRVLGNEYSVLFRPAADLARKSTLWIPDFLGSLMGSTFPAEQDTIRVHSIRIHDKNSCLQRFINALRIPTVARVEEDNHVSKDGRPFFEEFHGQLRIDFPRIFKELQVNIFNEFSMMITWKGTSNELDPIVLISHLDVVPADGGNWTYAPFSGTVSDDYVWSRGALDTKFTAISIMEALNQLLMHDVSPKRTVIIALGHDEEVGGFGARRMAEDLESKSIRPSLVLDEGGFVVMDTAKNLAKVGLQGPFAFIGTGEKVAMNWKITVRGSGGHASLPDTESGKMVASRLASIVSLLDKNPMPTKLESPTTDMVRSIGDTVTFWPLAWLMKHVDNRLINPIVGQIMGSRGGKAISALVRSTFGIVNLHAGQGADNVLPQDGYINVNIRTLPSDSRSFVKDYLHALTKSLQDDVSIEDISAVQYPEGTVTPSDSPQFMLVKQAIQDTLSHRVLDVHTDNAPRESTHGMQVASMPVHPVLLTGMTDSRWYHKVAPERIIRFSPFSMKLGQNDLAMIHGVDEKVGINEYFDGIRFFTHIIQKACIDEDQSWST